MNSSYKVNEAERENPQVKSLRLAAIRLVNTVTNKLVAENDLLVTQKLNASLTVTGIAMTILKDDFLRASRLLSNARRLANVKEEEEG